MLITRQKIEGVSKAMNQMQTHQQEPSQSYPSSDNAISKSFQYHDSSTIPVVNTSITQDDNVDSIPLVNTENDYVDIIPVDNNVKHAVDPLKIQPGEFNAVN